MITAVLSFLFGMACAAVVVMVIVKSIPDEGAN